MASAFEMNTDTKKWMTTLKILGDDLLPKAMAETLNVTADAVTKQQIKNAKSDFIIRTKYTLSSMKSNRAKPYLALNKAMGKNIDKMFSRAGTYSSYLWKQEEGGTYQGITGNIPIPTLNARIGKSNQKVISKKFRIDKTNPLSDGNFGADQFIGTVNGKRGVYRRMKKGKLQMLRNLDSDSIRIKGTGFHSRAVNMKGNKTLISDRLRRIAQKMINKVANRG